MATLKKARICILSLLALLLLALSLCGCNAAEKEYEIAQCYFDTIDLYTDPISQTRSNIVYTVACALPLTQYSYSLELYDESGEVTYTAESTTVNASHEANEEIVIEHIIDKEILNSSKKTKLTITGTSAENPSKLKTKRFTVTYMCNGEKYKTERVRGGRPITITTGQKYEDLIFCDWYLDPQYTFRVDATDRIYRDKTLYGKYTVDMEEIANEVTTSAMKSMVSVSHKFSSNRGTVSGYGSGVIFKTVGRKHYVLTNAHVVQNEDFPSANYIYYVTDCYGNKYDAYACRDINGKNIINKDYDLACVYFYADNDIGAISIADTDITVGECCISLGNPLEQKNAATYGYVGHVEKRNNTLKFEVIVHSAIVTNGCSGGPLLNSKLQLVGINYAKINNDKEFTTGIAIPLSKVLEFISLYPELSL